MMILLFSVEAVCWDILTVLKQVLNQLNKARESYQNGIPLKKFVKDNPDSELAAAVKLWGYGPRIVY